MAAATDAVPFKADLDTKRFVSLLEKLIGETKRLQNNPPELVPEESLAARHVLDLLSPYSKEKGGPLEVREITYVKNRSNVILKYPAAKPSAGPVYTVAFVGSHMDVVPADPAQWKRDPFKLTVEGDELHGRGTTDCLGHVALVADLFIQLATQKPQLSVDVAAVLIADEESGGSDDLVGVDGLMKNGELGFLKHGVTIWLDCADMQPNIGSGGVSQWFLTARGKAAHSGFPHKGVNAIELANDALAYIQKRFYEDFPVHEKEKEYGFPCPSSLKPTSSEVPPGGLNEIKGWYTIKGDIRCVPFYKIKDVRAAVERYVKDLNEQRFKPLDRQRGPSSYIINEDAKDEVKGVVELKWNGPGIDGLACDIHSDGYKALAAATTKHVGHCKPLADTGSLPLVAELQEAGYDVQTVGYGLEDSYHAPNEFAKLSDFEIGFHVLVDVINDLNAKHTKA